MIDLPGITISPEDLRAARVLVRRARAVLHECTKEATKDYHDALARTWIEFERIERGPWLKYAADERRLRRTKKLTKQKRAELRQANLDEYEAAVKGPRETMITQDRKAYRWYQERTYQWYAEFWKDVKPVMYLFNTRILCEGQREILHPFIDIDAEEWDSLEAYAKRIVM